MTNLRKHGEAGVLFRKLLNGRKLIARDLASMGKIQGTLCILVPSIFENANPVITHWAQPRT